MEKSTLSTILIISAIMNVAVVVTVGWNLWVKNQKGPPVHAWERHTRAPLTESDMKAIRDMWSPEARKSMSQLRAEIETKHSDLIKFIVAEPENANESDRRFEELLRLKDRMERAAFGRISRVMANLPKEKRASFALAIRNRSCAGTVSAEKGRGVGLLQAEHHGNPRSGLKAGTQIDENLR